MAYPAWSSDTHTAWSITPLADQNSANPGSPIDMTGASGATVRIQVENYPAFTGSGVATIVSSKVQYKPAPTDLAKPGSAQVQVNIEFSDGSILPAQPVSFEFYPAL
jgi:hypothetical protein